MKKYMIITKQHYNDLKQTILNKDKANQALLKKIKILENDKQILLNIINPDISKLDFPNSNERGQGDIDTPDNLSIWEL